MTSTTCDGFTAAIVFGHRQLRMAKGRKIRQIGCAVKRNEVVPVGDLRDDVQTAMNIRRRMHRVTMVLIMSLGVCQVMCCCKVPAACFYIASFSIYLGDGPFLWDRLPHCLTFLLKSSVPFPLMQVSWIFDSCVSQWCKMWSFLFRISPSFPIYCS